MVEDDSTLLEVLSHNLRHEGYQVVTATDGIEALDRARREKPDLIILDLMLPELDGLEVCRILRREMTVPVFLGNPVSGLRTLVTHCVLNINNG